MIKLLIVKKKKKLSFLKNSILSICKINHTIVLTKTFVCKQNCSITVLVKTIHLN